MTLFKKIIYLFLFITNTSLVLGSEAPSFTIINPMGEFLTIDGALAIIIGFIFDIGIPIAIIMYIWAAFQLLASGGEDKKINKAKQTIIWTTIGLAVILISQGIPHIVRDILSVSGVPNN